MDFDKKVELILGLRNTSLTIWGFLITVAIGVLAFLATLGSELIQPMNGGAIIALCALFFISNGSALYNNFRSRSEINSSAVNDKEYEEFRKLLMMNVLTKQQIIINMVFHFLIDLLVIVMIFNQISWSQV